MPTINDALRAAGKLLLEKPTTGYFARTVEGESCGVLDAEADCFCFEGALLRMSLKLNLPFHRLRDKARLVSGCKTANTWDYAGADRQMEIANKLASVTDP